MLNVYDLEKKHKLYKLKTFVPYIVIFVSLCVILIVILFVKNSNVFKSKETTHNQQTIQTQLQQTKDTPKKEVVEKNETIKVVLAKNEKNIILSPSLNFISSIKHNSSQVDYQIVVNKEQIEENTKKEEIKQSRVLKPAKKEPEPVIIEEVEFESSNLLKIHRQNTKSDIKHVIKRFKKNNNPALSLFIAKKYYDMQDYHQSYNYALITNGINDNIDISWIIFAKSLVKLDRKDEAIETLKRYFKHSKSSQARTLLEEIERGKFK